MSTGVRVPYQEARAVADALVSALSPACLRLEIAGSIRRGADDAGDVELVAVPRVRTSVEQDGLWGSREVETSELTEAVEGLIYEGVLAPHPEDPKRGERYMKLSHVETGLQLDLFVVRPPAQFGVIHLIRTGPAGYSQGFVTEIRKRGHHVADGALHVGGIGLGCPKACIVVDTPDERAVYAAVRMPWVNPEDRR